MSVYCTLFSQTFYGLLFCYLTITDVHVTLYLQIIDFQFPSCCTSQPPKKLNQIITVNSSTNTPRSYHQKNNSCTLCVPMFCVGRYAYNFILLDGRPSGTRWTMSPNDWTRSLDLSSPSSSLSCCFFLDLSNLTDKMACSQAVLLNSRLLGRVPSRHESRICFRRGCTTNKEWRYLHQ